MWFIASCNFSAFGVFASLFTTLALLFYYYFTTIGIFTIL